MIYIILIVIIMCLLYGNHQLRGELAKLELYPRDFAAMSELLIKVATNDKTTASGIKQLISIMGNMPIDTYNRIWFYIAGRYNIPLEEIETDDGYLVQNKVTREKVAELLNDRIE